MDLPRRRFLTRLGAAGVTALGHEAMIGLGLLAAPAQQTRFDLPGHWSESIERFQTGLYRGTAKLRASVKGLRRLRDLSDAVAEAVERAEGKGGKRDRRGWITLTIPIESHPLRPGSFAASARLPGSAWIAVSIAVMMACLLGWRFMDSRVAHRESFGKLGFVPR